jgi:hypothetical protein
VLRQAGIVTSAANLESTLLALQPALAAARYPWWVLGSAAVMLHGGQPDVIRDVDVLFDPRDTEPLLAQLGLTRQIVAPDEKFRSDVFVHWNGGALPVEMFTGFRLCEKGEWREYVPQSRIAVRLGAAQAFVPERAELVALLYRFGRPKDLERAALLT